MDIDSSSSSAQAAQAEAMNEPAQQQQLIEELGALLEALDAAPQDLRRLRRQVELMIQLGMVNEAVDAANVLVDAAFLGEALWIKLLDAKVAQLVTTRVSLDAFADMLELFGKAESEYLSAAIFKRHMHFLVCLSGIGASTPAGVDGSDAYSDLSGDEEVTEYLSVETVRAMLEPVATAALGLLSQSQAVWQVWMDWELILLANGKGKEREEQLERIHNMYLERLQVPQTTLDETSSAYSTFISEHCVNEYEMRMVKVTNLSQLAKKKWTEKRHGKTRADFEEQLAFNPDASTQLTTLQAYLDWETDPMAKNPKWKNAPRQDPTLIRAVFERMLLSYGNIAATAEEASFGVSPEQQSQMIEMANTYKTAEALIWGRYLGNVAGNKTSEESNEEADITKRAIRACPTSGELWSRQLIVLEEKNEVPAIDTSVELATGLIVDNGQPVTALVDVLYTHATILHRRYRSIEAGVEHPVFANLAAALDTVTNHYKLGDTSFRLEKFFVAWAEATAPELLAAIIPMLEKPVKARLTSYQFATLLANAHVHAGDTDGARSALHKAMDRKDLDWPEAVYDALRLLESVHGTLETVLDARRRIDGRQARVDRRRAQEAEKQQAAAAEQYRLAAERYTAASAEATVPAAATAVVPAEDAMEVDTTSASMGAVPGHSATTVPATMANEAAPQSSATVDKGSHLQRDRENTTVLVTGLKKGVTAERLTSFFENWAKVREVTILPREDDDEHPDALVEFRFADAMPDILEKGRRKFDGGEIRVTMLWRSTLYVTNFGKSTDDVALRKLFSQYGRILQTRWPSRKYAEQRRFCYITMESPAAAQEALVLDQFKLDGGELGMTVVISDPAKRKKRTDESDATLFVGGLNETTSEEDVRQLFAKYGKIVGIKLGWDPVRSTCEGFAFVEMSNKHEADAAVAGAHGTRYKGRGLKVTISDPHHSNKKREGRRAAPGAGPGTAGARAAPANRAAKAERRGRQVTLHDLPLGTQEGLLQQALEKIVSVRRVEVFAAAHEALVELDSQADAGLLLMKPVEFGGVTLRVTEQHDHHQQPRTSAGASKADSASGSKASAAAAAPTSALAFQPRVRKAKAALGKAYVPPKKAVATAPPAAAVPSGSGQDVFRAFVTATNKQRQDELEERKAPKGAAAAPVAETGATEGGATAGQKHQLDEAEHREESNKRAKKDGGAAADSV